MFNAKLKNVLTVKVRKIFVPQNVYYILMLFRSKLSKNTK